jgi:uncharacterized protein DUF4157
MVGHNLASRSLRHLRFARQMTAGQPLLARAIESVQRDRTWIRPDFVSVDGNQLPVGRIVRYLPRSEPPQTHGGTTTEAFREDMREDIVPPSIERALRLLPRQPAQEPRTGAALQQDESPTPEHRSEQAPEQPEPRSSSRKLQHAQSGQPPTTNQHPAPPAESAHSQSMKGEGRPRSRIVELPGVLVVPVAHEDEADDVSRDSVHDDGTDQRPDAMAEAIPAEHLERDNGVVPSSPPPAVEPSLANTADTGASTNQPPRQTRRRGKQSGPPPRRASDDLFLPTDADRSPQTWFTRLQQATRQPPAEGAGQDSLVPGAPGVPDPENRQATPALPRTDDGEVPSSDGSPRTSGAGTSRGAQSTQATAATVERPTALAETSRRVLYAATGIDPVEIPIYRGTAAERLTAAQNADALTDGSAIALGAGYAADAPETLGLLAHELTHIAQRRRPRFVPPVIQHQAAAATTAVSPADEETQAKWAEARVADAARVLRETPWPTSADPVTRAASLAASVPQSEGQRSQSPSPWGHLPAPWEPLPAWVAAPAEGASSASASATPSLPASNGTSNSTPLAPQISSAPQGLASSTAPGTQRAERGRSLPSVESEASVVATAHEGGTPEPDLDILAQQVHAILKRRLAAERRRFG